jgi:hypothetical protein
MADHKDKCAHPSCNCRAANDSKFCSAFCEGASEKADIICNCGHTGCAARETASTSGGVSSRY